MVIWAFDPNQNDGFPYIVDAAPLQEKYMAKPYPLYLWRIEDGKNNGYPFFLLQPPPAPVPVLPVKQLPYICIYDMDTDKPDFAGNGLAVLCPTSCDVTHILNGEYSLTLVHPIDPYGKSEHIREENIIKALGQLFTIKSVWWDFSGTNSGTVTVYAEHISYQLNDPWIFPFSEPFESTSAKTIMQEAMERSYYHYESGQHIFGFELDSDMVYDTPYTFTCTDGRTVIDVILGSGGLIEVNGGSLYRDNFYLSLNAAMKNAKTNAFDIRLGRNATGISRTVDLSTFCTYYRAYDQYGGSVSWAWVAQGAIRTQFPHHIVRSKNYNYPYDDYEQVWKQLQQDAAADFHKNCQPVIAYEMDMVELSRCPDFQELNPDFDYTVGNSGTVFDPYLGQPVTLTVTGTVQDAITGKWLKVNYGALQSFTRPASYPAIPDPEAQYQGGVIPVRDSQGVFCFDANNVQIVIEEE